MCHAVKEDQKNPGHPENDRQTSPTSHFFRVRQCLIGVQRIARDRHGKKKLSRDLQRGGCRKDKEDSGVPTVKCTAVPLMPRYRQNWEGIQLKDRGQLVSAIRISQRSRFKDDWDVPTKVTGVQGKQCWNSVRFISFIWEIADSWSW